MKIEDLLQRINPKQLENFHIFPTKPFTYLDGDDRLYYMATPLCNRLGLNQRYISTAFLRGYDINADIKKYDSFKTHFVHIPDEVTEYLKKGYLSVKLCKEDKLENFEFIYKLSKNCNLGFFKIK